MNVKKLLSLKNKVFLASEAGAYINGENILMDGSMYA